MNILTIISITILLIITLLLVTRIFSKSKKEAFSSSCSFIPKGITRQECLDSCNLKKNNGDKACNKDTCEIKCDGCTSTICKWKQDLDKTKGSRVPVAPRIKTAKAFSGDRQIKLVWVEPISRLPINKYILVCEADNVAPKIFYPNVSSKLMEYTIFNLENDKEYRIKLYAENDAGLSVESNIVTAKPKKQLNNSLFDKDKNIQSLRGIDDSMERSKKAFYDNTLKKYQEKIGYNEDDKDYYDIIKLIDQTKPQIDLKDENINIKFV